MLRASTTPQSILGIHATQVVAYQWSLVMGTRQTSQGTSIRLFLVDGRPDGLRLVEMSNWTGVGIVCSRAGYPKARVRGEYSKPGIYLLLGPGADGLTRGHLYIGEADQLRGRIDKHAQNKDFWTEAVSFTS
jgi:hypothetical protein